MILRKLNLTIAFATCCCLSAASQVNNYAVGETVSDFTATDIHGHEHTLSEITAQGKWVLIDFYTTGCEPCKGIAPVFSELHEKYGCNSSDLFCLSVDAIDLPSEVLDFENTYATIGGYTPPPVIAGSQGGFEIQNDFGVGVYPTFAVIGPDMKLKSTTIWPQWDVSTFETSLANLGCTPTEAPCPNLNAEELDVYGFEVFPNPSAGNVTISFENPTSETFHLIVSNIQGQVVYTSNAIGGSGETNSTIDLSSLSNGQYLLQLSNETTSTVEMISIEH